MNKRPALKVAVGDTVLIGTIGMSMPGDWFFATVILVCGDEIATEHTPAGQSSPHRQFLPIEDVRGAGEYGKLRDYQDRCRKAVDGKKQAVEDALNALVTAREAVWDELDKIAAEPMKEPI